MVKQARTTKAEDGTILKDAKRALLVFQLISKGPPADPVDVTFMRLFGWTKKYVSEVLKYLEKNNMSVRVPVEPNPGGSRTAQVPAIRMLPCEKALIEEACEAMNVSVTDWIRNTILYDAINASEGNREIDETSSPAVEAILATYGEEGPPWRPEPENNTWFMDEYAPPFKTQVVAQARRAGFYDFRMWLRALAKYVIESGGTLPPIDRRAEHDWIKEDHKEYESCTHCGLPRKQEGGRFLYHTGEGWEECDEKLLVCGPAQQKQAGHDER